jgi:hypothetical protein
MVLNHDQRVASKLMIQKILSTSLCAEDVERAMGHVDQLYTKYPLRTEIYIELKKILEREFEIDPFTFYFIILDSISKMFNNGLEHLNPFFPSDLDKNDMNS